LLEEGLEVFADGSVQDALFGFATAIGSREGISCGPRVALVGNGRQGSDAGLYTGFGSRIPGNGC